MSFLRRVSGLFLRDRVRSSVIREGAAAPPRREEPPEVARASGEDASWTPGGGPEEDPGHAGGTGKALGFPRRRYYSRYQELAHVILKRFPGTDVKGNVGRSGAFEVQINGQVVFSKLEQHGFPHDGDVSGPHTKRSGVRSRTSEFFSRLFLFPALRFWTKSREPTTGSL
uniref:Selenoprotein W n=1 Tax=Kryptolebias marmoratus TaxID=37003 RepID=A0A3Q3APV0_KRYMA